MTKNPKILPLGSSSKDGGETLTDSERRELIRRRDEAMRDLDGKVAGIRAEIREILREAREKGQAQRLR
jgi:hypothetical protein